MSVEVTKIITTIHPDGSKTSKEWEPFYKPILDHGYIGLIDFMGDDDAVVQAARTSYGKGTKATRNDEGLIRYLMKHNHSTPFEMVEFKFHVKAPIFVFRQWHRHRTASINEMSGRYSVLDNDMYIPDFEHCTPQAKDNKQGRQNNLLDDNDYNAVLTAFTEAFEAAYNSYLYLLEGKPYPEAINNRRLFVEEAAMQAIKKLSEEPANADLIVDDDFIKAKIREYYEANELAIASDDYPGIAKELARCVLPVSVYSQMYWKTNLKNLLHFIRLRSDPHAQYEIRVYSDAMLEMIEPFVPMSVQAFLDYQMHSVTLSRMEVEALRWYFDFMNPRSEDGETDPDSYRILLNAIKEAGKVSDREIDDFKKKILCG